MAPQLISQGEGFLYHRAVFTHISVRTPAAAEFIYAFRCEDLGKTEAGSGQHWMHSSATSGIIKLFCSSLVFAIDFSGQKEGLFKTEEEKRQPGMEDPSQELLLNPDILLPWKSPRYNTSKKPPKVLCRTKVLLCLSCYCKQQQKTSVIISLECITISLRHKPHLFVTCNTYLSYIILEV